MAGREDWRELPLVTIDPADAKDHDDAVHARADDDPENQGGFVLTVAIADVAAYVRPGSALDREALDRGNSVYFPDRVVPMLPERISNDLCSLRPDEDRPALAVRMIITKEGRKLRHSFHRIMMRSAAKIAYPQAQAAIDGWPDELTKPLLEPVLKPLWEAYHALRIARRERSPLDLDLPERKLILTPEGKVDKVLTPPRLDAHRLIEEFMILANVAAAETLESKSQPLVYRAHDAPSIEKVHGLSEFLATIGIKLAKGQALRPCELQRHSRARARDRAREHRQRGRAAQSGAGGIHIRELRPFRPEPAALRAFHLAHSPLRRPHRASRAYPVAEVRRRRPARFKRGRTRRDRRAHFGGRAPRDDGRARDQGQAHRDVPVRTGGRGLPGRASRASRAQGFS